MRTVMIVAPHFPPVDAADMHRTRIIFPYLNEFGWSVVVLGVDPAFVDANVDPLLLETLPPGLTAVRTRALSVSLARRAGFSNVGLRALPFLWSAGLNIIRRFRPDVIYFSTTAFAVMSLGRLWKEQFGIPYTLDMQDAWLSDYRQERRSNCGSKGRTAIYMHRRLERWTMQRADGIIAVSRDYISTLHSRYPWLANKPAETLPFGAANHDFEVLRSARRPNRFFQHEAERIHGVYVGRGGADLTPALRLIFGALRIGLNRRPHLFGKIRLHFIGTDYARADRARESITPVAVECGVASYVQEHTGRVPYFEALQLLRDADFLVVPGSDDPQYTASKIFPYILAKKPLLAVFHERSSVCSIVRSTKSGALFTFPCAEPEETASAISAAWEQILLSIPCEPQTDWKAFEPYGAREMARRHCLFFDQVVSSTRRYSTAEALAAKR